MANSKIEEAAKSYIEDFNYGLTTKEHFVKIALSDAAKEYWFEQFKEQQKDIEKTISDCKYFKGY